MSEIRFPRTMRGWWRLTCLAFHLCPFHLKPLRLDPWSPWDRFLYCFDCKGWAMYPRGLMAALRSNARAAEASPSASDGGGGERG